MKEMAMRILWIVILALGLSQPAQAKRGNKKKAQVTEKLNAYVELLNLTGRSMQTSTKLYVGWKAKGLLGEECGAKQIRWPLGIVTQFVRLQPSLESALKRKGKTKVDTMVKQWLTTTIALKEIEDKVHEHFKSRLYEKDKCTAAKKLVATYEKSFSDYGKARRDVSTFFDEKELVGMKKAVKEIKKKHGNGYWYAQANLLLQSKLLLATMEKVMDNSPDDFSKLTQDFKVFSTDFAALNKKVEKNKTKVSQYSSYKAWVRQTESLSKSIAAYIKIQDQESFAKLKKHEQLNLKNLGNFKRMVEAYNRCIDTSNRIHYSKDFH